jgi:hypothetical protein
MQKSKTKKRKVRPAPSYVPLQCVVLAVDCAQESGWAIWANGKLVACGHVNMHASELAGRSACEHAMLAARELGVGAVLVFERPFRGNTQGAWIGLWKNRWVAAGGAKRRMLGMYPATWRSRVLGPGWGSKKRALVRAKEQQVAAAFAREQGLSEELARHGDVAPALCIGKCAVHAGEVAKVLPKRVRRAA